MHHLRPEVRRALLRSGRIRRYKAGEHLMEQGTEADGVVIILARSVKVTVQRPGGRPWAVAFRHQGDIVGELATVDQGLRTATVTAMSQVVGLKIAGSRFRELLATYTDCHQAVTRTLVVKLRMATRNRTEFDKRPVLYRVAVRLLDQAEFNGVTTRDGTQVRLTHEELAELTGAAKAAIEKALRELREPKRSPALQRIGAGNEPVIYATQGRITIIRRDVLERLVG
jgi:CRP-like cAMP-binding protein